MFSFEFVPCGLHIGIMQENLTTMYNLVSDSITVAAFICATYDVTENLKEVCNGRLHFRPLLLLSL